MMISHGGDGDAGNVIEEVVDDGATIGADAVVGVVVDE
jgi:uncharacterized protein YbjQ (UPF0145 family)